MHRTIPDSLKELPLFPSFVVDFFSLVLVRFHQVEREREREPL